MGWLCFSLSGYYATISYLNTEKNLGQSPISVLTSTQSEMTVIFLDSMQEILEGIMAHVHIAKGNCATKQGQKHGAQLSSSIHLPNTDDKEVRENMVYGVTKHVQAKYQHSSSLMHLSTHQYLPCGTCTMPLL